MLIAWKWPAGMFKAFSYSHVQWHLNPRACFSLCYYGAGLGALILVLIGSFLWWEGRTVFNVKTGFVY